MTRLARLYGSGASLLGTLFQLAVIAETVPVFPHNPQCLHCGDPALVNLLGGWMPFIENLGAGEWSSEVRRCPGIPSPGTSFRLDHAPLPAAYRPFDHADVVLACVRVDSAGSVRAVRLIAGTGKAGLDRELVRMIRRQWRFEPQAGIPIRPGWQRIRLSSRPLEPVVTFPTPPPFSL